MDHYRELLASAWPDSISDVGAPPPKLDPQFLASLKPAEFGLYGRNTRGLLRNQVEQSRASEKVPASGIQAPKFLSEIAREYVKSSANVAEMDDKVDQLMNPMADMEIDSSKSEIPPMYHVLEMKYSKFGTDDFDFG
jgi:PAB-dependent poly(A)-specific ribonuclease subunit 2